MVYFCTCCDMNVPPTIVSDCNMCYYVLHYVYIGRGICYFFMFRSGLDTLSLYNHVEMCLEGVVLLKYVGRGGGPVEICWERGRSCWNMLGEGAVLLKCVGRGGGPVEMCWERPVEMCWERPVEMCWERGRSCWNMLGEGAVLLNMLGEGVVLLKYVGRGVRLQCEWHSNLSSVSWKMLHFVDIFLLLFRSFFLGLDYRSILSCDTVLFHFCSAFILVFSPLYCRLKHPGKVE